MKPQPEMHGRRLSDDAFSALPMPSWTQIEAVVWIRRQILCEAASKDTMEQDHAGNGRRELRDGTQSVVVCATSEGRVTAEYMMWSYFRTENTKRAAAFMTD